METDKLRRDAPAVLKGLKELPDGRVVALKPCKIYIPRRFADYGLAMVGVETHILGIYAIVMEDQYYAVNSVNAMVSIDPFQTNKIKIDGDEYYEFVFPAGSTVITNLDLVKTDTLTYLIFDEFFQKGNIPWYVGYEELGKIFDTAKKHAGANIGMQREVTQLIVSIVARDSKDRTKNYRTVAKTPEDLVMNKPVFIPLMSVRFASTNTMTKLGGSYFGKGLNSALIDPSDRPERIETILRK